MSIFKQNSARHRAETPSHVVRNTTIAAAAGAAVVGSVAPAQAYAQAPAVSYSAPAYSAPAASTVANYTSYTYQAPVTQAPAAQSMSVTPQSTSVAPVAGGLAGTAMQGVGSAYVYGGTAFGAWDCSGFTQWVYAQHGIDLPRTSQAQWAAGTPTANPQPGDLVIQNGGGHVGVYLGNGQMISALNPTQGTQVHSVSVMPVTAYVTF
jgi:cell wall-associated NlpC family hydrolase